MLKDLIAQLLLEDVSRNRIINSMKNRVVNLIYYDDPTDEVLNGYRTIEIYAYGVSKAGNPVIFAWLRNNMSKTLNSGRPRDAVRWRMFRLDRIKSFQNTIQKFDATPEFIAKNRPKYNGDYKNLGAVYYKIEPTKDIPPAANKPLNELFDSAELKNDTDKASNFVKVDNNKMKELGSIPVSKDTSNQNELINKYIQKVCPILKKFTDKKINSNKVKTVFEYNFYNNYTIDEFINLRPIISVEVTKNGQNFFIVKTNFDLEVSADDDNEIFKLKHGKSAEDLEFDEENMTKMESLSFYQTAKGIDKLKAVLESGVNGRINEFKQYLKNKYELVLEFI